MKKEVIAAWALLAALSSPLHAEQEIGKRIVSEQYQLHAVRGDVYNQVISWSGVFPTVDNAFCSLASIQIPNDENAQGAWAGVSLIGDWPNASWGIGATQGVRASAYCIIFPPS